MKTFYFILFFSLSTLFVEAACSEDYLTKANIQMMELMMKTQAEHRNPTDAEVNNLIFVRDIKETYGTDVYGEHQLKSFFKMLKLTQHYGKAGNGYMTRQIHRLVIKYYPNWSYVETAFFNNVKFQ